MFVWFCIFYLSNILQKVLEHFSHWSSHLMRAQIFAPFHCLRLPWCNISCKFLIIGLNSGLRFSCKALSLYLRKGILKSSCKVLFLKKDEIRFFSERLCIFQLYTYGVVMVWKRYHNLTHFSIISNFISVCTLSITNLDMFRLGYIFTYNIA